MTLCLLYQNKTFLIRYPVRTEVTRNITIKTLSHTTIHSKHIRSLLFILTLNTHYHSQSHSSIIHIHISTPFHYKYSHSRTNSINNQLTNYQYHHSILHTIPYSTNKFQFQTLSNYAIITNTNIHSLSYTHTNGYHSIPHHFLYSILSTNRLLQTNQPT